MQISERKAQQLVRAFAALPTEISEAMDAAKIALHTRLRYLQLDRGNRQAAAEIWDAIKERETPELLTAAVRVRLDVDTLDADAALAAAQDLHADANVARQQAATSKTANPSEPEQANELSSAECSEEGPEQVPSAVVDADAVEEALSALKDLVAELSQGIRPSSYAAGSLRLYAEQLLRVLEPEPRTTHSLA